MVGTKQKQVQPLGSGGPHVRPLPSGALPRYGWLAASASSPASAAANLSKNSGWASSVSAARKAAHEHRRRAGSGGGGGRRGGWLDGARCPDVPRLVDNIPPSWCVCQHGVGKRGVAKEAKGSSPAMMRPLKLTMLCQRPTCCLCLSSSSLRATAPAQAAAKAAAALEPCILCENDQVRMRCTSRAAGHVRVSVANEVHEPYTVLQASQHQEHQCSHCRDAQMS